MSSPAAHAATGNAITGATNWTNTCSGCHATPQPNSATAAFSGYGNTANLLAVYANNAGAIATAPTTGYIVPAGNTGAAAGSNTNVPMGGYAATLGTTAAPTQFALDVAAYFATLFAVPNAPTIGTPSSGNGQVSVAFSAPSSALTITSYTANCGGFTATGAASPLSVFGLSNGTAYTCTVTATSNAGTSLASAASTSVTPSTIPNSPTGATATAGNAGATVSFSAPVNNGGASITGYTVISNPAGGTDTNAATTSLSHAMTGLVNGTPYTFTVVASNIKGSSLASSPSTAVTPSTIPGAATGVVAVAGNTTATVTFVAPASNGGSTITGYTVISNPAGGTDSNAGTTGLSHAMTGLVNGTAYTFTVVANNANGAGAASTTSTAVTPATVPNAPTIGIAASAGNGAVSVSFSAPVVTGGSSILDYTANCGGLTATAALSPITVSGLSNGTAYTCTVTARNAVGSSLASATSNAATPATVPGAPSITGVTLGNAQATVAFTAPASNGGSTITGYTVISNPAGGTDSNAATTGLSHLITGLANGTAYTFTVVATSTAGSTSSAPSNSFTPSTIPGAATGVVAVAGNTTATVTFVAPASNGGSTITGYTVISNPAGGTDSNAGTTGLSHAMTGLVNGTAYTFTVVANNANGAGAASTTSTAVTPATVPNAPTIGIAASAGNGAVSVSFSAPVVTGGSSILDYTANCGGLTATAALSPITVSGLSNGTAYTCTVTARNAVGSSLASATSNAATPATVPGAPSITGVTLGNAQATVAFTAPASNGGATITGYTVISNPAGGTDSNAATTGLSHLITGLANGTAYTFTVVAINSAGSSLPSGASTSITPQAPPTANAGSANVAFNSVANVITPTIAGVVNPAGITISTAPLHGTASASASNNTISYAPTTGYSGTDTFSYTVTGPGGTSAAAIMTITVGKPPVPTVTAATLNVTLNTPATLDLTTNATGYGVTGISVGNPAHGTVTTNGMKVTYTPAQNYFGNDAFTYSAIGLGGTSAAATVTVIITGRPDPSKDATVVGLLAAQADTALRFSGTQISNYQHRLEALHHRRGTSPNGVARLSNDTVFNTDQRNSAATTANNLQTQLDAATTTPTAMPTNLLNDALALATTQSVNVAHLAGGANSTGGSPSNSGTIWAEGIATFGKQDATGNRNGTDFATNGISIGMDKPISEQFSLGFGVGLARDKTNIGTDGSNNKTNGSSLAVYGSYQPDTNMYLDALLGIGTLNFDTQRFVTAANTYAQSNRKGQQFFASLTASLEQRNHALMWSPYARVDFSSDTLKQATEVGAGLNNLTYMQQTNNTLQGALGLRLEMQHDTSFGTSTPRLRTEYRHNFQADRVSNIAYADTVGGTYSVSSGALVRNTLVIGLGDTFQLDNGLHIDVDYQHQHTFSTTTNDSIRMIFSKDLDGPTARHRFGGEDDGDNKTTSIQIDSGFMYDDNVTRNQGSDKLGDRSYSVNANKNFLFPLNANSRLVLTGTLGGEKFTTYDGLSRVLVGAKAEYQYRTSSEFGAPIFSVFARTTAEQYQSLLRDGYRYAAGVSMRDELTDRINFFTALTHNQRYGKSSVFDTRDNSARVNFDYALSATSTLYLGGEYRKGDIVSTGHPSLDNVNIAKVFVPDDAYANGQLFSYRLDGKTVISSLGYNLALGSRDALDVSWRRANSIAANSSSTSYVANQYSVVYLIGF